MTTRDNTEALDAESSPFAAEDYVQMACQLRRCAEISVRYPNGNSGGVIVNKGELWHAWDNLGQGNEAFLRMVGLARVTQIRSLAPTHVTARTIWESCQKLLLQAVILQDASNASFKAKSHDEDAEAVTARSHTERPVELSVAPVGKPRSITTFLRQPAFLQRAAVALFGITLIGSVGQIVASPAGGTEAHANAAQPPTAPNQLPDMTRALTTARRSLEVTQPTGKAALGRPLPADIVVSVSALETIDWVPPTVPMRAASALECAMADSVRESVASRSCE